MDSDEDSTGTIIGCLLVILAFIGAVALITEFGQDVLTQFFRVIRDAWEASGK